MLACAVWTTQADLRKEPSAPLLLWTDLIGYLLTVWTSPGLDHPPTYWSGLGSLLGPPLAPEVEALNLGPSSGTREDPDLVGADSCTQGNVRTERHIPPFSGGAGPAPGRGAPAAARPASLHLGANSS